MNRSALKTYAPKARREFIQAVTDRAAFYGLTKDETQPVTVKGDVAIIGGKAFPRSVAEKRAKLEDRIERLGPGGFERTMEAVAYTWFNRLVAIRYMELHGYLDHGYRVLSHPEGKATPEIVEHAEHVELPGLNSQRAIELKLDGTKESELFRMLLLAQCNALHSAMPFLFERIDDETELLLPENLLHSDSIVRKLVSEIDEADWQEVEIIGWLYQFYISEKKDEVIGKVVKSEDIPAATQLFTPNWIVKYLVQNSLGRQWLATYPDSTLKSKWEYYIEPAEQTLEVQAKLKEITPTTLNPEDLTIMDPACGSGHILVEAYDLLKDIYLERGYRLRDIPRLILTKNVYGLEIDDRAAQLACFALLMKARADDRKIFDPPPQLNVLAIQETNGLDIPTIVQAFTDKRITKDDDLPVGEFGFMVAERAPLFAGETKATPAKADEQVAADLKVLLALFVDAKVLGSFVVIPPRLAARLPVLATAVAAAQADANIAVRQCGHIAESFVRAAQLLARQFHAIAANPPYMGHKYMCPTLKAFVKKEYPDSYSDVFSVAAHRFIAMGLPRANVAFMTPFLWMILQSYECLRREVVGTHTLTSLIQPQYHTFFESAAVPICAFVLRKGHIGDYRGTFVRLIEFRGAEYQPIKTLEAIRNPNVPWCFRAMPHLFTQIPGCPIAYWLTDRLRDLFITQPPLSTVVHSKQGLATADNDRFLRYWHEIEFANIAILGDSSVHVCDKQRGWRPHQKGGSFRRWYGNHEYVVDWRHNGSAIRNFGAEDGGRPSSRVQNEDFYGQPGISWSDLTIAKFAGRLFGHGFLFDITGPSLFQKADVSLAAVAAYVNSSVFQKFLDVCLSGMHYSNGAVATMPWLSLGENTSASEALAEAAVKIARADWDAFETSWGFAELALLTSGASTIDEACKVCSNAAASATTSLRKIETATNELFVSAYKLKEDVSTEVEIKDITLFANPVYRYPAKRRKGEEVATKRTPEELASLVRTDQTSELVSYSVGCAMGRYSLDKPGLIYANSGNNGFDPSQYKTFPADPDGIIPITEHDWFPDSAARRFEEFVGVAWPKERLEENLQFVADSLTGKSVSDPRETIRSYFANDFYKHHLQTYKKRPIYWLFCSGKQRAFQALVYLHRYHEGTLARMRTEYVIPLQGKIASRIAQLDGDISKATSSAHAKKLTKEKDALEKQRVELLAFDEKLRHYADQRIKLDLDDGVKVNYGKFGDLLAEVKAICGTKDDED